MTITQKIGNALLFSIGMPLAETCLVFFFIGAANAGSQGTIFPTDYELIKGCLTLSSFVLAIVGAALLYEWEEQRASGIFHLAVATLFAVFAFGYM